LRGTRLPRTQSGGAKGTGLSLLGFLLTFWSAEAQRSSHVLAFILSTVVSPMAAKAAKRVAKKSGPKKATRLFNGLLPVYLCTSPNQIAKYSSTVSRATRESRNGNKRRKRENVSSKSLFSRAKSPFQQIFAVQAIKKASKRSGKKAAPKRKTKKVPPLAVFAFTPTALKCGQNPIGALV